MRTAAVLFLFLNFLYLLTSTGRVHTIDEISSVIQTESLTLQGTTAVPQAVSSRVYYGKVDQHGKARSRIRRGSRWRRSPGMRWGTSLLQSCRESRRIFATS